MRNANTERHLPLLSIRGKKKNELNEREVAQRTRHCLANAQSFSKLDGLVQCCAEVFKQQNSPQVVP